jgi:hypothetical protein
MWLNTVKFVLLSALEIRQRAICMTERVTDTAMEPPQSALISSRGTTVI